MTILTHLASNDALQIPNKHNLPSTHLFINYCQHIFMYYEDEIAIELVHGEICKEFS